MPAPPLVVVAAVAAVDAPEVVLPAALRLAEEAGAVLHLVHALPAAETEDGGRADAAEAGLRARARGLAPRVPTQVHVRSGAASQVIAEEADARGAGLVVVGASRRATFARALLGTTPQRVLRAAHAPVLVLRAPPVHPPRRVLLANDLSGAGAVAHEVGLDAVAVLAPGARPALRSLHVAWAGADVPPGWSAAAGERAAARELAAFLAERCPRGTAVEAVVRGGHPARVVADEAAAWGADLLVVGTHGRSGAARFLLGSVAESVLRLAPCNVLVVPSAPRAAERPWPAAPAAAGAAPR